MSVSVAAPGSARDLDRQKRIGRAVVGIAAAEVRRRERIGCVLGGRTVLSHRRRIVHRRDVDRDGVGGGIKIDAAIGRAAIVLHLEGEAGIASAVGIGRRRELQQPAINVRNTHRLPRRHRNVVVGQRARPRQRRDLHRQQRIGRACRSDR